MESSLSSARPENVAKTDMHPLGGRNPGWGQIVFFEWFKKANCPLDKRGSRFYFLEYSKTFGFRTGCPLKGFKRGLDLNPKGDGTCKLRV